MGETSFGWDDALDIFKGFPGAQIKSPEGKPLENEKIYNYYVKYLSQLDNVKNAHIKRCLALETIDGRTLVTSLRIPIEFDLTKKFDRNGNPLDSIIVPQGFDKPFSQFTEADREIYDQQFVGGIKSLLAESEAQKDGVFSGRSITENGIVWIFSNPDFRLFQSEDSKKVAELSGKLTEFYGGHSENWVVQKYGTTDGQDRDPHGFFTTRRMLLLYGKIGNPLAMLALVRKRGGSWKTNTLRVEDGNQRRGLGKAIKLEVIEFAKATSVRKLYCTVGSANEAAVNLNLSLGYTEEARLTSHYKVNSDELILGLPINRENDEQLQVGLMLHESIDQTATIHEYSNSDFQEFKQFTEKHLSNWHDQVDNGDFIDNLVSGSQRGLEDVKGKGKLILLAKDSQGEIQGVACLTLKLGEKDAVPAKLYPLIGSKEAIQQLVMSMSGKAKKAGAGKLYTFAPEVDQESITYLNELGFQNKGTLIEPYKPGYNLVVFEMFI